MRTLSGFAAGVVVAAAIWVILDLQTSITLSTARPFSDSATVTSTCPQPASASQVATHTPRPAAPPAVLRDEVVLTTGLRRPSPEARRPDRADEWIPRQVPTDGPAPATPAPRRRAGPRIVAAAGIGTEVPLAAMGDGSAALFGVRVLVEPDRHFGFELGLARALGRDRAGLAVDGIIKWHVPIDPRIRPYASAGVGWRRERRPRPYDAVSFPIGVGVAYQRGRWFADGRLTLRAVLREDAHTAEGTAFIGLAF
jgi:hypothetical protein